MKKQVEIMRLELELDMGWYKHLMELWATAEGEEVFNIVRSDGDEIEIEVEEDEDAANV